VTNLQIRVPIGLGELLTRELHRPMPYEPVVFALASHATLAAGPLVLVREVIVPPDDAFLPANGHGARWKGSYTIELLNRAISENLGILIFHAHGMTQHVQLSSDDRASANQLLPRFQHEVPFRAHGSIVVGDRSVAGMVLVPGSDVPIEGVSLRILDDGAFTWPQQSDPLFEQQPITDGSAIRRLLKKAVVAVVGLSGGGSQVVPHLASFGVGEIIAIDNQDSDTSNQFATPNLGWLDVLLHLKKTTSAHVRTWLVNRAVKLTKIRARVPEPLAVDALKRADVIVGCVNNLHARADINELAWRYCIPYIDIGLSLRTAESNATTIPKMTHIAGNLITSLPGGPCLWCIGFVDDNKLAQETGGRGRSYLQGRNDANAYVSGFNSTLASEAANEVLRLLTGVRRGNELMRVYDGFAGTLLECAVNRQSHCKMCNGSLAAGDLIWTNTRVDVRSS